MTEDELKTLIAAAEARFNALTPEQQKEHREEQRRSWVRGEMAMSALVKKRTLSDGTIVYDDYASYCTVAMAFEKSERPGLRRR